MQGRFNINSLIDRNGKVDTLAVEQFARLLLILDLDPRIAGITADWLDADQDTGFPDGAEDPIYSSKIPPYRTANQFVTTPTELLAVEGVDSETFAALRPYIAALPASSHGINVNTAPAAVLQSVSENISAADVEALLSEREDGGIGNVETRFQALATPDEIERLADTSSYFQLKVVVQIATVRITYYSLLYRDIGGTGAVVPLWRSFGTL
jgi:general secretion pathway protein K